MNILIGLLLLFLFGGVIFKIFFGALGLVFKLVFGVVGLVFGLVGLLFGGGFIVAVVFALIGGLVCIPISLFAKK